jgi:hypothetical protein
MFVNDLVAVKSRPHPPGRCGCELPTNGAYHLGSKPFYTSNRYRTTRMFNRENRSLIDQGQSWHL